MLNRPELLLEPPWVADSASWFWASNVCSALADRGDVAALAQRINGGSTGLKERRDATARALAALAG